MVSVTTGIYKQEACNSLSGDCVSGGPKEEDNEDKYEDYNRPFYRYGGHIELTRFKEYYTMPRGHENISFVFSSAFRDIFP